MTLTKGAGTRGEALRALTWTSTERWLVRFGGLATFVILGRLLDPVDFGVVALAASAVTIVQTVSSLGFGTYLVQAPKMTARTINTCFWTSAALGVVAATALAVSAPLVASLLDNEQITPVLRLLSLSLVTGGLASTPTALLMRDMKFKSLAIRQITAVVVGSVAGIVAALVGWGVYALVVQTLTTSVISLAVTLAVARWPLRLTWSASEARSVASYGTKSVGVALSQQARDQGEVIIIGAVLGPAVLGLWVIAYRVLAVLLDLVSSTLSSVALPLFSRMREDRGRLSRAYGELLSACSLVAVPVFVAAALSSDVLVPLLFGERWSEAGDVAALLAWGAVATAVTFFDRPMFIAVGKLNLELALVIAIVVLHLAVVGVASQYGLIVLAVAVMLRPWVTWPLRMAAINRSAGVPFLLQRGAVVITSTGTAIGVTVHLVSSTVVDSPTLLTELLAVAAFLVAYAAVMLVFMRPLVARCWDDLRRLLPGGHRGTAA